MPVTHRILRTISGVDHLSPGDLVDATSWRNVDKLTDQRYLEKLSDAEIAAHEAGKVAKAEKAEAADAAARAARQAAKPASATPAPAKPAPASKPSPPTKPPAQ